MKKEDLLRLGVDEKIVEDILKLHGTDIEAKKNRITELEGQVTGLNTQLGDANKQIASFKSMDIDAIKKAATDWEGKFNTAQAEATKQINQLRFDHALEKALTGAKARNAKAVKALLKMDDLKLSDDGETIIGLEDQIGKVRKDSDYLFEPEETGDDDNHQDQNDNGSTKQIKVVTGAKGKAPVGGDKVVDAMWQAAGLKQPDK